MNNRYFIAASSVLIAASVSIPDVQAAHFPDVQQGTEMGDAIYTLANKQILNGYPDGYFKAHLPVTRGQVAKIIANTLQLDYSSVENPQFQDIPTNHLFYPYIAALTNIGVFHISGARFDAERPMTRAEVAKVLTVAFDLPSVGQHPFKDVDEQWSYYINALYSNGITTGTYPTIFDVDNPVTRGQLALFIDRLQKQLQRVQATFTSEQFGNEPIAAMVVSGHGDEKAVRIESNNAFSNITISAKNIGSAYVYVGPVDPVTHDWNGTPQLYRFSTSLTEGKLLLTKTFVTEPIYAAVQLPIYDGAGAFSFTYVNGQPVAKDAVVIESKRNEFDGEQEQSIWLKNIYGQLLVSYTNKDGKAVQKAIFVEQKPYALKATVGDYVKNSYTVPVEQLAQYGLTDTFIDSKVFEGKTESSKVHVAVSAEQIVISPQAAGQFTLYLVDTQYRLHPVNVTILPFGEGYLLQLNE